MKQLLPILLVLAGCGGSSAAPSASYEEEAAYSNGGGGAGAEAPMSDDAGGEATSVEGMDDVSPSMVREPEMHPVPGMQPNVGTTRPDPTADFYQELVQASIDLDQATTLSAVDCSSARDLRDRICELSSRICDIAEDNPHDDPTVERCRDGRARCRGASNRVDQSCP